MYDNLTLYRLTSGELIVADEMDSKDDHYMVKGPHSIVEQQGEAGQPPRVMLQPSIPHDEKEPVLIKKDIVAMTTKAPDNIKTGYASALSNIIMPNRDVKVPSNITPLSAGLK